MISVVQYIFLELLMVNFCFQMKDLYLCQIILVLRLTHSTYFEFLFYTNALYTELSVILVTQVKVKPNNIQSCTKSLYTKCYFGINQNQQCLKGDFKNTVTKNNPTIIF